MTDTMPALNSTSPAWPMAPDQYMVQESVFKTVMTILAWKLFENFLLNQLSDVITKVLAGIAAICCCSMCRRRHVAGHGFDLIYADGSRFCHLYPTQCYRAKAIKPDNRRHHEVCEWCEKEFTRRQRAIIAEALDQV